MDQQSTDPNNPPAPVAPASPASMWGGQNDLPVSPVGGPANSPVLPMDPVPTFIPPSSVPTTPNFGENPMAMPATVPVSEPVPVPPAPVESDVSSSSVPSWASPSETPANPAPAGPIPTEATPTDLSNLMGNAPATPSEVAQPTVVVSPTGPETNQVVTSGAKGFPKIVLILGAVLILIALGASAYFILGIGNSSNLPASLPAEQQTLTTPPKIVVPTVAPVENATGAGTLGNPSGATTSGMVTPTKTATTSGTSALELLRSRITPTPVR